MIKWREQKGEELRSSLSPEEEKSLDPDAVFGPAEDAIVYDYEYIASSTRAHLFCLASSTGGRWNATAQHFVRALVHVGGCGYHLPPGATITLVAIDDKFRAHSRAIRRRLYTVRVGFDLDDPAIMRGNASAATSVPLSAGAMEAVEAGKAAAAAEDGSAGGTAAGGNWGRISRVSKRK